jgi:uncharacterized membrane-anchored protein
MFVFSFNKKTLRHVLLGVLALVIIIVLAIFIAGNAGVKKEASAENLGTYSLLAKNRTDIDNFLLQFDYIALNDSVKEEDIKIPKEFNDVYSEYNELQKSQGLDLSQYKGQQAKQFTFMVEKASPHSTEEPTQQLYAVLIVRKGYVIGGHLETGLENSELMGF